MDAQQLAKLDGVIKWAEDNPELHNQHDYAAKTHCGTAYCIAGKLDHDAGVTVVVGGWEDFDYTQFVDERPQDWETYAAKILGIDYGKYESDLIFRDHLTLDDIKRGRDVLAENYGLI